MVVTSFVIGVTSYVIVVASFVIIVASFVIRVPILGLIIDDYNGGCKQLQQSWR